MMRWNAGFTVLELLVTLAIMAVIAAIAIPSYKEFKTKAHIAVAKSQIGELYSMQKIYYQEHNRYANFFELRYIPQGTYYFDHGDSQHGSWHGPGWGGCTLAVHGVLKNTVILALAIQKAMGQNQESIAFV